MLVTNKTSSDIYFGPLHLAAGVGETLTVDDTSATSLYLLDDSVADALNNAYNNNQIDVSGAADPFPRPVGDPKLYHGSGNPEGLVYAPQGSVYMRRDGLLSNGGVLYMKTSGQTFSTDWLDLATASGTTAVLPAGLVLPFAGSSIPSGWVDCDGSAISRSTYALLFTAIGTTYGVGDGSTTFNVPDLRDRVAIGAGGNTALAGNEGVSHTNRHHTRHQHSNQAVYNSAGVMTNSGGNKDAGTAGSGIATDPNDGAAYLALNYIIKT